MNEIIIKKLFTIATRLSIKFRKKTGETDIDSILRFYKIECRHYRKQIEKYAGQFKGAIAKQDGDKWCIYVNQNISEYSKKFTKAHELGHYFLYKLCNWNPVIGSDHKRCEDICDQFAVMLLLPQDEFLFFDTSSAFNLWKSILHIQMVKQVSHTVVIRKCVSLIDGVCIFACNKTKNIKGDTVYKVIWVYNNAYEYEDIVRRKFILKEQFIFNFLNGITSTKNKYLEYSDSRRDFFVLKNFNGNIIFISIKNTTHRR